MTDRRTVLKGLAATAALVPVVPVVVSASSFTAPRDMRAAWRRIWALRPRVQTIQWIEIQRELDLAPGEHTAWKLREFERQLLGIIEGRYTVGADDWCGSYKKVS